LVDDEDTRTLKGLEKGTFFIRSRVNTYLGTFALS